VSILLFDSWATGLSALTKLSYLLAKPVLTPTQVRSLISLPLRGELTPPAPSLPAAPSSDDVHTDLQGLLSHFVRLSYARKIDIPQIVIGEEAQDAAAPWSRTAAERASTEAALMPFLVHLAVARDDLEGLEFCIASGSGSCAASSISEGAGEVVVPGGVVNCLDAGSGRSPLHIAALNGSTRCVEKLLESGALVHLRDALGHTALYYVSSRICGFGTILSDGRLRVRDMLASWILLSAQAQISGEWKARRDMWGLRCTMQFVSETKLLWRCGDGQGARPWIRRG
jgi:hypothetical protein